MVGDRGRLVLPVSVRRSLGLAPGTPLLLTEEGDGSLRLTPYRAVANRHRGVFAGLVSDGGSLVDELLAQRRAEADRER